MVQNVGGYVERKIDGNTGKLISQTMYLSPFAFKNDLHLFIIGGHELVHVKQNSAGLFDELLMENGAWQFILEASKKYGDGYFLQMAKSMLFRTTEYTATGAIRYEGKYYVDPFFNDKLQPYLYTNFININFKPIDAVIGNLILFRHE